MWYTSCMKVTKAIKPSKPATPEIGDILGGWEYLSRVEIFTIELFKTDGSLPNRLVVSQNHGFNLADIGVDVTVLEAETRYKCPWTENYYHWFYPLGVITDDETKYSLKHDADVNLHEFRPWACRKIENGKTDLDHVDPSEWGKITDAMLGHGFTRGTLPSDGHGEKVLATVPLDNGDELLVVCWVWFNK